VDWKNSEENAMALTRSFEPNETVRMESLAVLAHELRNPLAVIGGAVGILDTRPSDLASVKQAQILISRQLESILRLVEDLQDMTWIQTGKLELRTERVDLRSVVQRAVESSRPLILAGGHTLVLQATAGTIYVNADTMRLSQVLMNLIDNSTKFCHKQGRIVVCVERSSDEAILRVQDDGVGIAAEALPHVFELFVQSGPAMSRARRGFGMGLSLVKRIVELHGGTVSARSDGPGTGSEFIVRLPAQSFEPCLR
jgi:signal transduction histidine kinase